ncbi:hypothetical protein BDZ89DRAFT_1202718, partial [Hymenopellis radicata]
IQNHNATRFLDALSVFIASHGGLIPPQYFDTFNLYRRLTIHASSYPPDRLGTSKSQEHCSRWTSVPAAGRRSAEPAHLDFALVRTGERNERTKGTALEGLRVAHIRVLFEASRSLLFGCRPSSCIHRMAHTICHSRCEQVVYIPLRAPRETMAHMREIIYADRIVRNCHMQPKYGKTKPLTWTTDNVSDK